LEDDRQPNEEDYFEYSAQDVTNLGLGEAARRTLVGIEASCFSFIKSGFEYSPIDIQQGLPESPLNIVSVPNVWDVGDLCKFAAAAVPNPINWEQMLAQSQSRFDRLLIYPHSIEKLRGQPFSEYVIERIFVLLGVLQQFIECLNDDGSYSDSNHELIEQHFSGDKAWFTDESPTNKRKYSEEMNFSDLEGGKVFCSWHGKIKTPQYRIHFEWPVKSQSKLRIFYIGPKITKD